MKQEDHSLARLTIHYLLGYAIWAALFIAGMWYVVQITALFSQIGLALSFNRWLLGAISKYGILLLGLVWLIYALYLEHYLRTGVQQQCLWPRAARAIVFSASMAAFIVIGQQVLLRL